MNTYTVTQDGSRFEVRVGDANGPVVATSRHLQKSSELKTKDTKPNLRMDAPNGSD